MPEPAYEPATVYELAAAFESAQPCEPAATFEPAQPYEPVGGNAVPPVPPMPPAPPMPAGGGAIPQSFGAPMTDWRSSRFEGSTAAHFGMTLVIGLLTALSLGFAVPALKCWFLRWKYRNTVIGGYRLKFNGTGGQFLANGSCGACCALSRSAFTRSGCPSSSLSGRRSTSRSILLRNLKSLTCGSGIFCRNRRKSSSIC